MPDERARDLLVVLLPAADEERDRKEGRSDGDGTDRTVDAEQGVAGGRGREVYEHDGHGEFVEKDQRPVASSTGMTKLTISATTVQGASSAANTRSVCTSFSFRLFGSSAWISGAPAVISPAIAGATSRIA